MSGQGNTVKPKVSCEAPLTEKEAEVHNHEAY